MSSCALNLINRRFNRDLKVWEIKFATQCGPRVAVGRDYDKTLALAERECSNPRRPTLVLLP